MAKTLQARTGGTGLKRAARMLAAALLVMSVAACAATFRNHGYVPTETELAQIEVGKDTQDTVAEKVGRPTAAGLLNDEGWFYVQSRYRFFGPREPQEIDRQVLAITFSPAGTVQNSERFGLEQGQVVAISRRVTESNIKGIGLINQLFSNFGRVGADTLLQ